MQIVSQNSSAYVLRFDMGEELITGLKEFCQQYQITGAWISGLGSSDHVVLAYYNLHTKVYEDHVISERLEVTALTGNVSRMKSDTVIHLHGVLGGQDLVAKTGHIKKLIVSATCEILLTLLPGGLKKDLASPVGLIFLK